MVGLLHSEHSRYLLRNSTKCRAPRSRRSPGTTYTDTAFASLTSWDGANAFQVFIHGTTSHLDIELLRSKKAVPSAIKNHARKYGIPNHFHSDRAPEFLGGPTLDYCLDITGGKNRPHQNSRAENMVGVIKGLTFRALRESQAPNGLWSYAMLYACKLWNSTAKRRLKDCTPNELKFGSTNDLSAFRLPFYTRVEYWEATSSFPDSTGMRDGIYLGPAKGEGDPFACYIVNTTTHRILTRSIFREHEDGLKPLDEFTKKFATLERPVDLYSDEACTNPVPDVGEDYVPTVIDDSCSFAIDLTAIPAHKNDAESAVDNGLAPLLDTATQLEISTPNEGRTSRHFQATIDFASHYLLLT